MGTGLVGTGLSLTWFPRLEVYLLISYARPSLSYNLPASASPVAGMTGLQPSSLSLDFCCF